MQYVWVIRAIWAICAVFNNGLYVYGLYGLHGLYILYELYGLYGCMGCMNFHAPSRAIWDYGGV